MPCGVPKTGFMIESMVTATARNLGQILRGGKPNFQGSWNAVCLADFGDSGIAFVAQPQIPPRNVNWSASGKWVHMAKIGFEKYFLRKMRKGESEPFYEIDGAQHARHREAEGGAYRRGSARSLTAGKGAFIYRRSESAGAQPAFSANFTFGDRCDNIFVDTKMMRWTSWRWRKLSNFRTPVKVDRMADNAREASDSSRRSPTSPA